MRRRSFLSSCAATALALALAVAVDGRAAELSTDTPTATIETLQQGLIAAASARPTATLEERYGLLEPVILATHDLAYIAEFALRRQWVSLAEPDRQRYIAAFQRLSVMTYAARFKSVGEDTFRALTTEPADSSGRVRVSTAVARAGQPDVTLEYLLEQSERGWQIINIVADGVSDLALKRAEYQRVFTSGGIAGLIAELGNQTQRLSEG